MVKEELTELLAKFSPHEERVFILYKVFGKSPHQIHKLTHQKKSCISYLLHEVETKLAEHENHEELIACMQVLFEEYDGV